MKNFRYYVFCVYFPTDYHDAQSRDAFVYLLREIEWFIDSATFDHLIIVGDSNVDFFIPSTWDSCLSDFLQDKALVCIMHYHQLSILCSILMLIMLSLHLIALSACDSTFASLTLSVLPLLYGSISF